MAQSNRVEFSNQAGEVLAGRLELPVGRPVGRAIFAHCFTCSKDVAAAARISRSLAARGLVVLRFDFTGLGNSEGDFANTNFSSNIEDLVAAGEWLQKSHGPVDLLVGHSLGGAAVLRAAKHIGSVRALATIGAPSEPGHVKHLLVDQLDEIESQGVARVNLAGREFRIRKQFVDDLDEQAMVEDLRRLRVATLIMHSPVDQTVGIDNASRIYQALVHPKSFVSLDDADHLLSRKQDSEYVADVLAAWASRYVAVEPDTVPSQGEVVVEGLAGGFQTRIQAGKHVLTADEPQSVPGGTDTGPNPYDLLLASLGACTSMTLHMYARHKKIDLQRVGIKLTHDRIHAKDCEDCLSETGTIDVIRKELSLAGDLDQAQRDRMLQIADRCPVHKTLMHKKKIQTTLTDLEAT